MLPSSGFRGEIVCHLIQRYERTFVVSWIGAFIFFRVQEFERGGEANVTGDQDDRPRLAGFHLIFSRRRGAAIPNSTTQVPCHDRWHSSRTISVAFTKPKKDSEL
jgi:hypothetical protein